MITFKVDGQPIPKGRPRVGKNSTYTPPRTVAWERTVGWSARAARVQMLSGDLYVSLQFFRRGAKRCDLDNLCKSVLDGLNGIAFKDDQQIVSLRATVSYNAKKPGVDVILMEVA